MDILTIVHYTSYVIGLILLVSIPVRFTLFSRKTGACLLELKKASSQVYISVIVLAIVMLVVLYFREFSLFVSVVLHGTALLALEIASREFLHRSKSGVYENMLVADGKIIKKQSVVMLPTLEYETQVDHSLTIATEHKGNVIVFFESVAERESVIEIVKKWQKK